MSTVALQIIVKDEFDQVAELIGKAIKYFDEVNVTVSNKTTANKLAKVAKIFDGTTERLPVVRVKWREWTDRFDEARNANFAMCTADYAFWVDADDEFDFSTIPKLVAVADEQNLDAIFLPYNYAQDENGNCITRHWRERLVRMSCGWEWRGWVHESLILDKKYNRLDIDQEVIHHSTREHARESVERNHAILEKAAEATGDPRYIHYLGMSHFTNKDYPKAIEVLSQYIEVGGSPDDIYRSLNLISEASYHLNNYNQALEAASKASVLIPEYPMAYWLLGQYEADKNNFAEALEWIRVSEIKPDPQTHTIWDPTSRERATLIAARCLFMLGEYNRALAELRKIPKNSAAKELYDDFLAEADKETFIKMLPQLRQFYISDKALWEALSEEMKYDNRLQALRYKATYPRQWGDKSIVIFCGEGYEEWGPHTTDKGMGGSEEAVVYLSRALAKLGWEVTVYGEVPEDLIDVDDPDNLVLYEPWKHIDKRDDFNVFVGWRAPAFTEHVNAKVKIADVHDILPVNHMKDYPDVKYFVKSNFHRELYPHLADDAFRVIGNGIVKDQFND